MMIVESNTEGIQRAIDVIRQGGIVAHPTETCYGFACDLSNPIAIKRLFEIKQRDVSKSVSGLFPTVERARQFVQWNEHAERYAKKYLPGACTLVLPLRQDALYTLYPKPGGGDTLGVRISSHSTAQQIAQLADHPVSTTSANLAGKPAAYSAEEILEQFSDQSHTVDLIIDGGQLPNVPPSTVIDLTALEPKTLR